MRAGAYANMPNPVLIPSGGITILRAVIGREVSRTRQARIDCGAEQRHERQRQMHGARRSILRSQPALEPPRLRAWRSLLRVLGLRPLASWPGIDNLEETTQPPGSGSIVSERMQPASASAGARSGRRGHRARRRRAAVRARFRARAVGDRPERSEQLPRIQHFHRDLEPGDVVHRAVSRRHGREPRRRRVHAHGRARSTGW